MSCNHGNGSIKLDRGPDDHYEIVVVSGRDDQDNVYRASICVGREGIEVIIKAFETVMSPPGQASVLFKDNERKVMIGDDW